MVCPSRFYSFPSTPCQVLVPALHYIKSGGGGLVKGRSWPSSAALPLVLETLGQQAWLWSLSVCVLPPPLPPTVLSKPPQLATCWQCWWCCSRCCVSVPGSTSVGASNAAAGGSAWRETWRRSHVHTLKRQQEKKNTKRRYKRNTPNSTEPQRGSPCGSRLLKQEKKKEALCSHSFWLEDNIPSPCLGISPVT